MSDKELNDMKVGFIGGGNMARAIGATLIQQGILDPKNVWVSARTEKTLDYWKNLGANTTLKNSEIVDNCYIIFLAIKPQFLEDALSTSGNKFKGIIISVIVGVTTEKLVELIWPQIDENEECNIIRTMPNLPLSVGEGITVYSCANMCFSKTNVRKVIVEKLFLPIGVIKEVDENLIDSIGALSGSGPAYAYQMIEALADGGVKRGIPRDLAIEFAAQVLVGAGKMVLDTGKHPGQLKDEVCSPGGSTIAGIHAMEIGGVRASLINAVEAAAKRSKELGS